MQINKIIRPSVGADYADEQNNPAICRGRFIVPIADLSALRGCSGIPIILLKVIIGPRWLFLYPQYFVKSHNRVPTPIGHLNLTAMRVVVSSRYLQADESPQKSL